MVSNTGEALVLLRNRRIRLKPLCREGSRTSYEKNTTGYGGLPFLTYRALGLVYQVYALLSTWIYTPHAAHLHKKIFFRYVGIA